MLGTSAEIAHELLSLAVEFSDFVPVPGLAVAAQTLLNIWDASQEVDVSINLESNIIHVVMKNIDEYQRVSASH